MGLDGSVAVEEELVQLDDGKVEGIFDDKVVEAVGNTDSVAKPVVCEWHDGRQNWRNSSVYASFKQAKHLQDHVNELPALCNVHRPDVEQNYLVWSESPDITSRFGDCLA